MFQAAVDGSVTTQFITHFWRSTGFCPPLPHQNASFILSDDQFQNLAHIGATPNRGIQQVRVHWLLDLVSARYETNGTVDYNFTALDKALDMLFDNHLRPGFEIMGNPSNMFTDFESKDQVYLWKDLVSQIAKRYIDRYGLDYVSSWNFETWNEPDNHDFDSLNFTVQGFLNYYDACLEGLKSAHESLGLGSPGQQCSPKQLFCLAVLQHCYNGTNYFTGKKGVEVEYLSFHIKGRGSSMVIVNDTIDTFEFIQTYFPDFKDKPFYNDEADPQSGWSSPEVWRTDARYAAMVVKIIALHQNYLFVRYPSQDLNYQLLSNDNGFLDYGPPNYFNQRTLTARFQMNLTKPRSVELVRKPVLAAMGLLSLLGSLQLHSSLMEDGVPVVLTESDVGVIASLLPQGESPTATYEASFLIYRSNDTSNRSDDTAACHLTWSGLPPMGDNAVFVHWQLDNVLTNPFSIWLAAGRPDYPPYELLQAMRKSMDSLAISPTPLPFSASGGYNFSLPLPSVVLLHACQQPPAPPSKVTALHTHTHDTTRHDTT